MYFLSVSNLFYFKTHPQNSHDTFVHLYDIFQSNESNMAFQALPIEVRLFLLWEFESLNDAASEFFGAMSSKAEKNRVGFVFPSQSPW